jgi:hypothetical protein
MSSISGETNSVTGAALTPAQQTDLALLGRTGSATTAGTPVSEYETPQEQTGATLLDLTAGGSSNVASEVAAGVPPDLSAASALVSELVNNITAQGSAASAAYSMLSAGSTLKLTR